MSTFGEILRRDRERLDLSQEELAEKLGVSQQAVASWESGNSHPRRERRAKLLEVLGPQAELVRNPPTTEFIPAEDMPRTVDFVIRSPTGKDHVFEMKTFSTPIDRSAVFNRTTERPWVGFSTARGERVDVLPERALMQQELTALLPEPLRAHVNAAVSFGNVARAFDYASEGVYARVVRGPTVANSMFAATHVVRLAMAVHKAEPHVQPQPSAVLFVLSDEPAPAVTKRMGSLYDDALFMGIKTEVVPDVAALARSIAALEQAFREEQADYEAWIEEMRRQAAEHEPPELGTPDDPMRLQGGRLMDLGGDDVPDPPQTP